MKTLHQLKTKAREELVSFSWNKKGIKKFLDTQIERAFEEGKEEGSIEGAEAVKSLYKNKEKKIYQTALEDVEKIVPKKDNRNFGIIGNDPNQWHRIGKKLAWNECIDTITSGLKKLKDK